MIAYLDSSVVLRLVLGESGALPEWRRVREGVCSALVEVECLRTLDWLRLQDRLSAEESVRRREAVYRFLEGTETVEITRVILDRAAAPMPAPLGTLDAIHLATALAWRENRGIALVMATHDQALAAATRAFGMTVIGA